MASLRWAALSEERERGRVRADQSPSAWELGFVSASASIQLLIFRCRIQFGLRKARGSDGKLKGFNDKDKFKSPQVTIWWYGTRWVLWSKGPWSFAVRILALSCTLLICTQPCHSLCDLSCKMDMMPVIPASWPCCVESKPYQACTVFNTVSSSSQHINKGQVLSLTRRPHSTLNFTYFLNGSCGVMLTDKAVYRILTL